MNGIYPALLTPLAQDGTLHQATLEASLHRIYDAGCQGVYIAGSTGEGLLLDPQLREDLTAATVKSTPAGRKIIVHVGANSTATAVRLAKHAEKAGAHAISSIAPPGPFSFDDIESYYQTLAAATSLPLILYFFPASAPAVSTYAHLERLCAIPNVAGVKFTSFDLYTLSRIPLELQKFVWNGHDEVLAAGLLMGACGGVGSIYNIEPGLFLGIYNATQQGNWAEARRLQDRANQLITIVLGYPLFPALKQILTWRGLDMGACVPPRRSLSDAQQTQLSEQLEAAGFATRR
ncbi:N-acetylneuraminate lyase [Bryobacterales bacterium F-183]|nr:N-acetylneuraminate lyase [Bryobacterales bacterium F-183]